MYISLSPRHHGIFACKVTVNELLGSGNQIKQSPIALVVRVSWKVEPVIHIQLADHSKTGFESVYSELGKTDPGATQCFSVLLYPIVLHCYSSSGSLTPSVLTYAGNGGHLLSSTSYIKKQGSLRCTQINREGNRRPVNRTC